jgi:hypothetical protein
LECLPSHTVFRWIDRTGRTGRGEKKKESKLFVACGEFGVLCFCALRSASLRTTNSRCPRATKDETDCGRTLCCTYNVLRSAKVSDDRSKAVSRSSQSSQSEERGNRDRKLSAPILFASLRALARVTPTPTSTCMVGPIKIINVIYYYCHSMVDFGV